MGLRGGGGGGGGGGLKSTALEHPFIQTQEDLISVEGQVWKMLMLERLCPAGLAKAKDQEGRTTGDGHSRGM